MNSMVLNRITLNNKLVETVLNFSEETNTLEIYDSIMPYKWYDESTTVTAHDVTNFLNNVSGDITVRINSRGGDVGTALAIYNRLKAHKGKVTTCNDGYAFSCAGWLMLAGEKRVGSEGCVFMMHNPIMYPEIKSEDDIERVANAWRTHKTSIKDIFKNRSKMSEDEVDACMNKETYMSADECLDFGIYTESSSDSKANLSALNCLNLNLPENIKSMLPPQETLNFEELVQKRQFLRRKCLQ